MPTPSNPAQSHTPNLAREFTQAEKQALYDVILHRRDVRNEFLPNPIDEHVLRRILMAAHKAPSVGLSQPWRFILVRDPKTRGRVKQAFQRANEEAVKMFPEAQQSAYAALKLEGIEKAPLNICVVCDRSDLSEPILGNTHNPDMDLYSTVCAVQNLWLAARAEGVGVGWVSIYHDADLREILNLPDNVVIVAYLCVGYVEKLFDGPELAARGWASPVELDSVIMEETWSDFS
ncbi:MAG: 5,6-dimethylbenzimidazole synthase [Alphaproteobacteria bacterium]